MIKNLIHVLIMLLLVAVVLPVAAQDDEMESRTRVIAHQGGEGLRPSNTMAAFEYAVELGVDMLELDIHSTADGVLVVIHDDTIDRTTNGTGRVNDLTLSEIQRFDAGYNWPTISELADVEERPYRGAGTVIPTLESIFQAFPDMPMTIEIKQQEPSIVEPFCAMIFEYGMEDKVIVASFHEETMFEFRENCPGVPTSAIESEVVRFVFGIRIGNLDEQEWPFAAFQVPRSSGDVEVVTPEFVDAAHEFGILVQVWTINDRESMQELIAMGVDGLITDFPDVALEVLGRSRDMGDDEMAEPEMSTSEAPRDN